MASEGDNAPHVAPEGKPSLTVIFKTTPVVRVTRRGLEAASADVGGVNDILGRHKAKLELLFGQDEARLRAQQAEVVAAAATLAASHAGSEDGPAGAPAIAGDGDGGAEHSLRRAAAAAATVLPDLSSFYSVTGEVDDLQALANELVEHDSVEAAYVTPPASTPLFHTVSPLAGAPSEADAPPVTPDFVARQGYLGAAPGGIEAIWARTQRGGKGDGIRICDVEWAWRFTHEDLRQQLGGLLQGVNDTGNLGAVNHGTAVAGVIGADENTIGVLGGAPNSPFYASSLSNGQKTSTAIKAAADRLRPGDVILLEVHRAGPNNREPPPSQQGYIAIEYWPDDFAAITYATAKGIVVVEAAGNGAEDLDSTIYDSPPPGQTFPPWWRNPFRWWNPQSGAVVVGAGAPPPGTHGRNWGPDRSRLNFSNWGFRVDAQGWGQEVTTTGYGTLQGGVSQDFWYTDTFNGTSSASPIVTSAVLSTQGVRRANGRRLLSSQEYRILLRNSGSPQQAGPTAPLTQRIGNRPNLRQLIPAALAIPW